ncbi:hypothetical protein Moror_1825 [Moniliophthora roreri MCA 2997]|nr:hypothetical protein Moror_1825 [Moniliophthora roreri MCA 2997]
MDELEITHVSRHRTNNSHLVEPRHAVMKEKVSDEDLDPRYQGSYEFTSSSEHGAVLALPEGSALYILENQSKFRDYARRHAKEWFQYAQERRGREFPPDRDPSLYMVTGCEKCSAWGIASFFNPQPTRKLVIIPFNTAQDKMGQAGNVYSWGFDGRCNTRCHPAEEDSSWDGQYYQNQCVFLRGFKVSKKRKKSKVKVRDITGSRAKAEKILDIESSFVKDLPTTSSSGFYPHFGSMDGGRNKPLNDGSCEVSTSDEEEILELDDRTTWERPSLYHPCDLVNNLMFDVSGAYSNGSESVQIAISHDDDWCSPDSSMTDGSRFIQALLSRCRIVIDNDIVYTEVIQSENEASGKDHLTSGRSDSIVRLEIRSATPVPVQLQAALADKSSHSSSNLGAKMNLEEDNEDTDNKHVRRKDDSWTVTEIDSNFAPDDTSLSRASSTTVAPSHLEDQGRSILSRFLYQPLRAFGNSLSSTNTPTRTSMRSEKKSMGFSELKEIFMGQQQYGIPCGDAKSTPITVFEAAVKTREKVNPAMSHPKAPPPSTARTLPLLTSYSLSGMDIICSSTPLGLSLDAFHDTDAFVSETLTDTASSHEEQSPSPNEVHYNPQWTDEIPLELIEAAQEENDFLVHQTQLQGATHVKGFVPLPNIPPAPKLPRSLDKLILNSANNPRVTASSRSSKARTRKSQLETNSSANLSPEKTIIRTNITSIDRHQQDYPPVSTAVTARSLRISELDLVADTKDPSVLPIPPSHVVLNHLCTSAIKNGVIAVGETIRYREKYVTMVYYKPT